MNNTTANSRFAKAGVSCFYDSEVLNSSFEHLMKCGAKNPRHYAKPQNVIGEAMTTETQTSDIDKQK